MANAPTREPFRVRPFQAADRAVLLELASRLVIGLVPWRDPEGVLRTAQGWVRQAIEEIGPDRAVIVAESASGGCVGFVDVCHNLNFSGEEQAYVGELVVAEAHEGQGIGRALMEAAETWARAHGLSLIVLHTGARNNRAIHFYKHLGYAEEDVELTKQLR